MAGILQSRKKTDRAAARLRRIGDGSQVFVLVHGIGVSHRYFEPLAKELARHGTVYSLDLPGFGDAPGPRSSLSMEGFAQAALAALRREGVNSAVLVGHSMGSQVVVEMARQSPEAADAVVLLGPTTDHRARTALAQGMRLLRDITAEPFGSNVVVFTDYLRCGPFRYARTLPAMLNYRTEQKIGVLQMPVLVVRGGRDPVAPRPWVHQLAGLCRYGRVAEVPGQPHVLMYGAPQAVAQLCRSAARR